MRTHVRMLAAVMVLAGSVAVVSAQQTQTVSASMELDDTGDRVFPAGSSGLYASEITFKLHYEWEQGAATTGSTEIQTQLVDWPPGFETSIEPQRFQVDNRAEGGDAVRELEVVMVPDAPDGNVSKVPEFDIVKVSAEAEGNGNVESASAEAHRLVPLRNASASEEGGAASSVAATSAGGAGAGAGSMVATALLGAVVGAVAGAVVVRRVED